jgi:hypothetical protein
MPSDRPNKPHGRFTPATTIGRLLSAAGYGRAFIRKGIGYGGHLCSWDERRQQVWIRYRSHDDTPAEDLAAERDEMLGRYTVLLASKGYEVERDERVLHVRKPKEGDTP